MSPIPAVADTARPALAPMYRLQFEPAQDCWVLLYPEGLVKLNGPASEIMTVARRPAPVAAMNCRW